MKGKWTLFTYPVMDIKAAEAMLNRRAAEGWRLEKVHLGALAHFVPAETPVCYCIDWYDPNREDGLDYRHLLADAGWHPVGQLSYWNLYEAPAGTPPIQTDGELEYQRFRKKSLRRMVISWAAVGVLAAVILLLALLVGLKKRDYILTFLTDLNTGAVLAALLPLLLPSELLWSVRLLLRLGQWRRAIARDESFPVPGRASALAARVLVLAGYLLLVPLVLAILLDAMAGSLSLGWIIGMIIACLVILGREPLVEYQRKRRYAKGTLVCMAVLLAAWLLPLSGVAAALSVRPPLADQSLLPERLEGGTQETRATLLAARTEWYEWGPMMAAGAGNGYAEGQAWVLPWSWLTDWVTEQYLTDMGTPHPEELPGYEDVWLSRASLGSTNYTEDLWLIRRGNTLLWVETNAGPLDTQWLDGILERLEEAA